jgi:hypothetical protein
MGEVTLMGGLAAASQRWSTLTIPVAILIYSPPQPGPRAWLAVAGHKYLVKVSCLHCREHGLSIRSRAVNFGLNTALDSVD